jgi:hypothetical protein
MAEEGSKEKDEAAARAGVKSVHPVGLWLRVELRDYRTLYVRRQSFERLKNATEVQLENYRLIGDGEGVHWPDLDEDISIRGFLKYAEVPEGVPDRSAQSNKPKIFCNACGREVDIDKSCGGSFLGYRVCSPRCVREARWRDTLSNLKKEYRPDPEPYNEEKPGG